MRRSARTAKKEEDDEGENKKTSPAQKRGSTNVSALAAGGDLRKKTTKGELALQSFALVLRLILQPKFAAAKEFGKRTIPQADVGEVFVVGSGDCGQLGLGPDEVTKARPAKLPYFEDKNIVCVAAGGLHNMALSADGKLYSWGCNDQKALGRSGEETVPLPVEGLDNVKIVQVVCGDSITAALTEDGNVYAWGTFRNKNGVFGFRPNIEVQDTPYLIPELQYVTHIDAGANHIAAITSDFKIYTWGSGEQNQFGRRILPRTEKESSLIARPINFKPRGMTGNFKSVFCGGHHTFMVHSSGAIFSFGLNNHGQLGVGDTSEHDSPIQLELFGSDLKVAMATGAEHHSIVLTENGNIYSFGKGEDGQLGTGSTDSMSTPTLLEKPNMVRFISANGAFSMAVTNEDGNNLYMWGYGEMGQLANGSEDADTPFHVELKGRKVYSGSCGGQHTVLLLSGRQQ